MSAHRIVWKVFLLSTGAASTAVEIVGLRLLAPIFGSSLPVWGTGIAVVLGGLAGGYAYGSKLVQRQAAANRIYIHAASAAALFVWLPLFMKLGALLKDYALTSSSPGAWFGATVISFIALLPPAIVFGSISPLAVEVEAIQRGEAAGESAGHIMALTTLGSLIGIVVPSFLTIPLLGTRETVWLFAGVVLVLSMPHLGRVTRIGTLVYALAGASASLLIPLPPGVVFAAETKHQYVTVHESSNGARALIFDAGFGIQSLLPQGLYTHNYFDYPATLPLLLDPQESHTVLVLGAAASAAERQMARLWEGYRSFTFTSVELDDSLEDIANTYFDPPPRKFVTADARSFVGQDTASYDIILVDAYARELTVPFHLATKEFYEKLAARSAPGGVVALNINTVHRDTLFMRSITRTLHEVFDTVLVMRVPHSCNHIVVASHTPLALRGSLENIPKAIQPLLPAVEKLRQPRYDGILLSDNRSPTDLLGIAALLSDDANASCSNEEI